MLTLNTYRPLRLADAMDRLFEDAFVRSAPNSLEAFALPLDVLAKNDEFVIVAAVPGLKSDALNVEVLGDTVTIRGELAAPEAQEGQNWLLQERRYGKFTRTLTLPATLDGAHAEASVENGLLTLRVPKAEAAKPKQIKVKAK